MNRSATSTRWAGLFCLLFCSGIFVLWGSFLDTGPNGGTLDFKAIYYGARSVVLQRDPYKPSELQRVYQEEGGVFPSDPAISQLYKPGLTICINLPTSLFLVAPFAMLSWGPAHVLWMALLAGSLTLAAFLMWDLAGSFAPGLSLFLICMVLVNSEEIFALGNAAGIVVGLCLVAVWCFLKERLVPVGILCMAIALALKPHDAGLVWLYFLLAGGAHRKRALQTLLVVAVIALPAALWVSQVSPHWMQELHSNLLATSAHGGINDPGPSSVSFYHSDSVIDLQSALSILWNDPRFYNLASYLVCGTLLLVGAVRTVRSRFSQPEAWFALAAIAALSMLPVYHRPHDAKLLMLTVPACALLWAEGGLVAWLAVVLNTAALILTGDIPLAILSIFTHDFHGNAVTAFGRVLTVVVMRPEVPVLLALGIFYLWIFLRRTAPLTRRKHEQVGEFVMGPSALSPSFPERAGDF